jgi:SAM-dependent methyltransferase
MPDDSYYKIVEHYEGCLERHGDTFRGVDYTREHEVDIHYQVMLDLIPPDPNDKVSLLDFGCGASHLYEYLVRQGDDRIEYSGLDISPKFIELCKAKHPSVPYYCVDLLRDPESLPTFDYIVMAGVLTEKRELTHDQMWDYTQRLLTAVFAKAKKGIAFNVMSKQVDWERDDLFHLGLDQLAWFLKDKLTRHFVIRNDYGLYEYTAYVYREPRSGSSSPDPLRGETLSPHDLFWNDDRREYL